MKKIFQTIILGTICFSFVSPVSAALTFCVPVLVPTTPARLQEHADCLKRVQESREEQEKINVQYLKDQKEINEQNKIEEAKKQAEKEQEFKINELKDRIVQLQIQLLTLKLDLLLNQSKK